MVLWERPVVAFQAVKLHSYDYRYASAVLGHVNFQEARRELLDILRKTKVPLLDPSKPKGTRGPVKVRTRNKRVRAFPVDQKQLNANLDKAFKRRGWQLQPHIVDPSKPDGPKTGLLADYKKGRLQVEVQFGNMARWYTDVFKFQLSYSMDEIDAAVLVVPMQRFANLIDENVAYFERVTRELPWAKMSLTLPILVLGVEPEDYGPLRALYDSAVQAYLAKAPKGVAVRPFEEVIIEEPHGDQE